MRTGLKRVAPPLLALLLSRALYSAAAWASGFPAFRLKSWIRWDSDHYLSIAQRGYEFVSCKSIGYRSASDWCGNAGWFPGYPLLIRATSWVLPDARWGAVLLPPFFLFLLLYLLWNRLLDGRWNERNLCLLTAAALFPGSIYFHAAFPISLTACLLVYLVAALKESSWRSARRAAFLAGISYSTGFVAAAYPWLLPFQSKENRRRAILVSLSAFAGLLAVIVHQWVETGVWGAFFKVQSKYGYGENYPLSNLIHQFARLTKAAPWSDAFWPRFQSVSMAFYMLALLAMFIAIRSLRADRARAFALSGALAFWIFPYLLAGVPSLYRSEALLVPSVLLLDRMPRGARWAIVGFWALLAFRMGGLFFRGILV